MLYFAYKILDLVSKHLINLLLRTRMKVESGKPQATAANKSTCRAIRLRTVGLMLLTAGLAALFYQVDIFNIFPLEKKTTGHKVIPTVADVATEKYTSLGLTPNPPITIQYLGTNTAKRLTGRFLHITDIHPDPLYEEGSSVSQVCHRGTPEDDDDYAARFGVAMGGCDGSPDLMEYTLKWIEDNLKDKIDFVVWTGDNIRHDNDRKHPRTEAQIFEMNGKVSKLFYNTFRDKNSVNPKDFDAQVIPSLGNNDVFPHNLFSLGPTLQTRELYNIWSNFIPEEQQRVFARDTSFFVEVIPGKLAVLSINTLYLYKANPLVDNCNSKKQPGYQLLSWLGYTLEELRQRGMKVWLSGHVPPIPKNFDSTCYNKFTLWTHEYRDVIIGGLYGHMNIDHFIPVDGKKAWKDLKAAADGNVKVNVHDSDDSGDSDVEDEDVFLDSAVAASEAHLMGAKPVNKGAYMDSLREGYYNKIASRLNGDDDKKKDKKKKKKKKNNNNNRKKKNKDRKKDKDENMERYSIVTVSTSIIPTFNPGFRVWEYNISGIEDAGFVEAQSLKPWDKFFKELEVKLSKHDEIDDRELSEKAVIWKSLKNGGSSGQSKKEDKTIPKKMPSDCKPGPAYTPQLFSPTKFVQYYADLKQINDDYVKALKSGKSKDEAAEKAFKYQIEYTSDSDPYPMPSLLTKDYIDLAIKLSGGKGTSDDEKLWDTYTTRAFASSGYKD